ncbi:unnamed protein product [Paramecium pentaurelia]|uniref:Uncharacterized protein n=1 Tax=Paramecium pentaurelia TaxID=43138 RepID=A0A8S1UYY4_9CILI|nr:unnamed protein product [Paramecium pentaurelia]
MSRIYQINELYTYCHSYYNGDKRKDQRNNQLKNSKYNNESRFESNKNLLSQKTEYNDNQKDTRDQSIKVSKEYAPQKWQINRQQTEYQERTKEKQKKRNQKNGFTLMNSRNDSQLSSESTIRRRKSQIDWLYSTQIYSENILIFNRVQMQNLFSPTELVHFGENQLLYETEEIQDQKFFNQRIIESKFTIQKSVKRLRLLYLDVLLQCSKCKQIIQVETNFIKQTQSPAILINHCNQNIRIDFFHNNNKNPNNYQNQIAHVAYVASNLEKIVIIRAECALICECENENDSILILENPLQLNDGNYIILANEPYRKLCRYCCKEVILQQCQLMIVS